MKAALDQVGVGGGLIKPMQSRLEDTLSKASEESNRAKNVAKKPDAGDMKPSSGSDGPSAAGTRR